MHLYTSDASRDVKPIRQSIKKKQFTRLRVPALLLLYDVTNKTSYDNIRAWLSEIREHANEDVVIMLLGEWRLYLWFPGRCDRSAHLGLRSPGS